MEMELTLIDQTVSFLYSVLAGAFSGFLYELFMGLKNAFFKNRVLRDIVDIIFILSLFGFLLFSFFSICALGFRIYHFIGLFLGIIIFFLTVGSFFYKIFEKIFKILKFFLKILLYPLKLCSIIFTSIIRRIAYLFKPLARKISLVYTKAVIGIKRITVKRGKI